MSLVTFEIGGPAVGPSRSTRTLGAATGGLAAAAFVPIALTAVALADDASAPGVFDPLIQRRLGLLRFQERLHRHRATTPGGADTLSDTFVTPFGNIPILTDFHSFLNPTDLFFAY